MNAKALPSPLSPSESPWVSSFLFYTARFSSLALVTRGCIFFVNERHRESLETISFKAFSLLSNRFRVCVKAVEKMKTHKKTHNSENGSPQSIDTPRKRRVYSMANIREKKKDGKIISYSFTVCLARDTNGKQVRRFTTWTPPEGLAPTKAKKAAERAADAWESEVRAEYQKEEEAKAAGRAYMLPPEKRHDDFIAFIQNTWFPLQVRGVTEKPNTIAFYQTMVKTITGYFQGAVLQEIGPLDIQKYLIYLRINHKSKLGKPLSPKSVRHQYSTLCLILYYRAVAI